MMTDACIAGTVPKDTTLMVIPVVGASPQDAPAPAAVKEMLDLICASGARSNLRLCFETRNYLVEMD